MSAPVTTSRWKANLNLRFEQRGTRTVISRRQHEGPLVIQKPFYPEGNPCHIYLLHPPGGLVGGDQLSLHVELAKNAHTLITTPGASKFYRSSGLPAVQHQQFHIHEDGLLEWLPQETILFDQANAHITTNVDLDQTAKFIGWEILCLGRPAGQQFFENGFVDQNLKLNVEGKPKIIERALIQGGADIMTAKWGLANYKAVGTMLVLPADDDMLKQIRAEVTAYDNELFSVTIMDGILVCRYLGSQAEHIKRTFTKVWQIARPRMHNINACIPRIWNT